MTTTTMTTTTITTSSSGTCKIGADVQCPGSGNMCSGDQCCPGFAGSGGGTFPCPSASSGFSGCVNNTKVTDCTSSGTVVTTTATTISATNATTITTSSSGPGCPQLSGRYCAGKGSQDCDCNYCDDFCQDTACARTCRVLNGYFSSPAQSTCQWSAAYVTDPSPDANGNSCAWMEGNGQ